MTAVSCCTAKRRGRDSNPRDPEVAGFQDRSAAVREGPSESVEYRLRALSVRVRAALFRLNPWGSSYSGSKPGNTYRLWSW